MTRIFGSLSVVVMILLLGANIHGYLIGDYHAAWHAEKARMLDSQSSRLPMLQNPGRQDQVAAGSPPQDRASFLIAQSRARWHTLFGLLVALLGVLVNCLSVTYFIGTGRWCREVAETYDLGASYVEESRRLKRRSFPWALLGTTLVMLLAATGAACDPGTMLKNTQLYVQPHGWISVGGTLLVAWALYRQQDSLRKNQELIDRMMGRVREIRLERGLPV